MKSILALSLLALASSLPASAQSKGGGGGGTTTPVGVITIDQAKAEAGGVTPGDAPGFPVTISQPGSYRLMGNLSVADMAATAIFITSPGVTLDLNGFELRGPNLCTGIGVAMTCSADPLGNSARGYGVLVQTPADAPANVVIQNGSVTGFASTGIRGFDGGHEGYSLHRVRVSHSGYAGVISAAAVTDSVIDRNRTLGIFRSLGVVGNTVTRNGGSGIYGSHVRHNTSVMNGSSDVENTPIN
jgi:hypothetical protein